VFWFAKGLTKAMVLVATGKTLVDCRDHTLVNFWDVDELCIIGLLIGFWFFDRERLFLGRKAIDNIQTYYWDTQMVLVCATTFFWSE
jgi:tmRNA-binding protein